MYIKHSSNSVSSNNQVQSINSNQYQQYVMVDNSFNFNNHFQHINHNSVAQPENILLPMIRPQLIRANAYYLENVNK
jgi:hypothetical protein